jgi:hypothetical protein
MEWVKFEADGHTPDIPMDRWGQDHWSTFAYFETLTVDNEGKIDNRRMRCEARLHREFCAPHHLSSTQLYPTRCKGSQIDMHDDWSCLEDMVYQGLITAQWKRTSSDPFGACVARVQLTDEGREIAGRLRAHKAAGNSFSEFAP